MSKRYQKKLHEINPNYKPKQKTVSGQTRKEKLDSINKRLRDGKITAKQAAAERKKMEDWADDTGRGDAKNEALLREFVREMLDEKISKSVEKTLKGKANKSGYTYGSLKTEFEKGLAAWLSGSRPGMSQHQWAWARVNKCIKSNPSWCQVKKSKAKKK